MQDKYPQKLLLRSALAAALGAAGAWAGESASDGIVFASSPRGAALTEMRSRVRFPIPHIAIFYAIGTLSSVCV